METSVRLLIGKPAGVRMYVLPVSNKGIDSNSTTAPSSHQLYFIFYGFLARGLDSRSERQETSERAGCINRHDVLIDSKRWLCYRQ
jgi:hypothetical protein